MLKFGFLLVSLACLASAAQVGLKLSSDESSGSSSEEKTSKVLTGLSNWGKKDSSEEDSSEERQYKNTTCQCGVVNKVKM